MVELSNERVRDHPERGNAANSGIGNDSARHLYTVYAPV